MGSRIQGAPLANAFVAKALNQAAIVAATDVTGTIVQCNDLFCQISGFSRHELIGANHRILNSGHHDRGFFTEMYRTIGRGETWAGTICNRRKDGELYWVDTTIVPQLDARGRAIGYLAIRFEVTEHMRALEALAEAREKAETAARAKGRFLANMSHELRTPLTGIVGMAHELAKTEMTDEQKDCVAAIVDASDSLQTLVNDVLYLAQLEAGGTRLDPTEVDVRHLLRSVVVLLRLRAGEKGLALHFEERDLPDFARIDGLRLRQVATNLIANAIKFTTVGEVTLSARWADGVLFCEVRDSGDGFSMEDKSRLFRPFEQGVESLDRSFGGTGLGLAISADLVAAMGGQIDAESTPGQGARFFFSVSAPLAEKPRAIVAPEPLEASAERLSVLVAEDNPTIQLLLKRILDAAQCDVTLVSNGLEAVEAAAADDFDLCLLDLRMPKMDGIAALSAIRRLARGEDLPIFAVSADVLDGRAAVEAMGDFDGFLPKPLRPDLIMRMLGELRACKVRVGGLDLRAGAIASREMFREISCF